jgi:hypothetical protein
MMNEEKACGMKEGINSANDLQKSAIAKRFEKASEWRIPKGFKLNSPA